MQIFEFDLKKKIKNLTSLFLQAEFCILLFWQCLTNFFFLTNYFYIILQLSFLVNNKRNVF